IGRTTVTCTASNAAGALSTCSFVVSVFPLLPAPDIQWQRTFGGSGEDSLQSLQQTSDGGYLLGGYSTSSSGGNKTSTNFGSYDYWIVRVDTNGNKLWEQSFGGNGYDNLTSLRVVGAQG